MLWQNALITRIETLSPRVKSFSFRLAEPFGFKPGQHVLLRLTAPDGYRAQRSYSIASAPGPGRAEDLEVAIERLDDGEVSPFLHDVAQVHDEIELRGPLGGYFNWSPEDGGPVLLIAGGSGVAPFMSMLRHRAALASHVPATLVFSARSREELLFFEELAGFAEVDDGFSFRVALTREAAQHPFRAGRIDAAFIEGAESYEGARSPGLDLRFKFIRRDGSGRSDRRRDRSGAHQDGALRRLMVWPEAAWPASLRDPTFWPLLDQECRSGLSHGVARGVLRG